MPVFTVDDPGSGDFKIDRGPVFPYAFHFVPVGDPFSFLAQTVVSAYLIFVIRMNDFGYGFPVRSPGCS
jgi:hypothetical protein